MGWLKTVSKILSQHQIISNHHWIGWAMERIILKHLRPLVDTHTAGAPAVWRWGGRCWTSGGCEGRVLSSASTPSLLRWRGGSGPTPAAGTLSPTHHSMRGSSVCDLTLLLMDVSEGSELEHREELRDFACVPIRGVHLLKDAFEDQLLYDTVWRPVPIHPNSKDPSNVSSFSAVGGRFGAPLPSFMASRIPTRCLVSVSSQRSQMAPPGGLEMVHKCQYSDFTF